jgi:hypothetical protein
VTNKEIYDAINPRLQEFFDGYVLCALKPNEDGSWDKFIVFEGSHLDRSIEEKLKPMGIAGWNWGKGRTTWVMGDE